MFRSFKTKQKEPEENTVNLQVLIMAVVSKTDIGRRNTKIFKDNNNKFRSFRAKQTFIRKKLGHTIVSAIKASSVILQN